MSKTLYKNKKINIKHLLYSLRNMICSIFNFFFNAEVYIKWYGPI